MGMFRVSGRRLTAKATRRLLSKSAPNRGGSGSNNDLDRINLQGIQLYGYHGYLPEEKRVGQSFIIDASLFLSLQRSGLTDNLKHTVNYASIYKDIEKVMKGPSLNLIEHLAETICFKILEGYPLIKKIQISIRKPEAPLPCPTDSFEYVGVTILRRREDFRVLSSRY